MTLSIRGARACVLVVMVLTAAACNIPGGGTGGLPVGGFETKPADQIIAEAKAAVGKAKTVHVIIKTADPQLGEVVFDLSVAENGDVTGSGSLGSAKFSVVATGTKTYVKGADFWTKLLSSGSSGDAAVQSLIQSKIDDHWVTGFDLLGTNRTRIKTTVLADCLDEHGTLTRKGTDTVNGKKVVAVEDRGEEPGGQASTLYVAVDSPHVLVRLSATGQHTPGTEPDKGTCKGTNNGSASPSPGSTPTSGPPTTVDFTDYDKAVKVDVPTDTVDIAGLFSG